MSIRAANIGVDAAMAAWECANQELPYFSVWFNQSQICFQYNGDDYTSARSFLFDNLSRISETGDNSLYYIAIHPVAEKCFVKKSQSLCSIPVRLNGLVEPGYAVGSSSPGNYSDTHSRAMADCIADLSMTCKNLNAKIDGILEDGRVGAVEKSMMDKITGILSHPTVAQLLSGIMPHIIGAFKKPELNYNAPASLAGVDINNYIVDEDRLDAALTRLESHCNLDTDMELLADMAENNQAMWNILLTQLRAGKK